MPDHVSQGNVDDRLCSHTDMITDKMTEDNDVVM